MSDVDRPVHSNLTKGSRRCGAGLWVLIRERNDKMVDRGLAYRDQRICGGRADIRVRVGKQGQEGFDRSGRPDALQDECCRFALGCRRACQPRDHDLFGLLPEGPQDLCGHGSSGGIQQPDRFLDRSWANCDEDSTNRYLECLIRRLQDGGERRYRRGSNSDQSVHDRVLSVF